MTSNIGSENNIHANHLNIFIFLSSLLLSSINSKLTQMIIVRNYNVKVSIKANSVGFGKIEYSIPDGYQVVGITLMDGGQSVLCQMTSISAGTFKFRNFNSSDIDVTIYATVILLKM